MKTKNLTRIAAVVALASAASGAFAQSAVLKVTGKVTPPACVPSFSNGGTIDFGGLNPQSAKVTDLGIQKINFQIQCASPAKVGIKVTDNRLDTQIDTDRNADQSYGFGLTSAGKKIGAYTIKINTPTVDGKSDTVVGYTLGIPPLTVWANESAPFISKNSTYAAATADYFGAVTNLLTGKSIIFPLEVNGYLNQAELIGGSDQVTLDGQATFDISYID